MAYVALEFRATVVLLGRTGRRYLGGSASHNLSIRDICMHDRRVHASEILDTRILTRLHFARELSIQAIDTWRNRKVTGVEIHRTSMQLTDIPDSTGLVHAGLDWSIIMHVILL